MPSTRIVIARCAKRAVAIQLDCFVAALPRAERNVVDVLYLSRGSHAGSRSTIHAQTRALTTPQSHREAGQAGGPSADF